MRRVAGVLSGDRVPTRFFSCLALSLKKTLEETADISVEMQAPEMQNSECDDERMCAS